MLSFEEYSQQTHRTAAYPEDQAELYLALGIADEAGELKEAVDVEDTSPEAVEKMTAEMGDVYWYVSELSRQLKIPITEPEMGAKEVNEWSGKTCVDNALTKACEIAGQAKKAIRDDNGEFTENRSKRIRVYLNKIRSELQDAAHHLGLGGEEVVLTRNAEKLSIRKEEGLIQGEGEGDERVSTA